MDIPCNAQGDVTQATDPDGHVTRHYLTTPRVGWLSSRFGITAGILYVRNALGQLIEETLPNGGQRSPSYDALGPTDDPAG